jgi:hypothetical protein
VAGAWRLYVSDDEDQSAGQIASWSVIVQNTAWTNDAWARPFEINALGSAMTTFAVGVHTNQSASSEVIPSTTGGVNESTLTCEGKALGKTLWYSANVPTAGELRLDAVPRPDAGADTDFDLVGYDPVMLVSGVDGAGRATGYNGAPMGCRNGSGLGVTESLIVNVPAGPLRIGVAGVRDPDYGVDDNNASDGDFELRGQFTPAPVLPPPPPDTDGDGIPDAFDKCPGAKPSVDADRDGCTDPVPRVNADTFISVVPWIRGGTRRGIAVTKARVTNVPAGARIAVRCTGCSRLTQRGARGYRNISITAKKAGVVSLTRRLRNTLVPRGRRLTFLVTFPARIGKRIDYVVGRGSTPAKKGLCLAVGRTDRARKC